MNNNRCPSLIINRPMVAKAAVRESVRVMTIACNGKRIEGDAKVAPVTVPMSMVVSADIEGYVAALSYTRTGNHRCRSHGGAVQGIGRVTGCGGQGQALHAVQGGGCGHHSAIIYPAMMSAAMVTMPTVVVPAGGMSPVVSSLIIVMIVTASHKYSCSPVFFSQNNYITKAQINAKLGF